MCNETPPLDSSQLLGNDCVAKNFGGFEGHFRPKNVELTGRKSGQRSGYFS